jgi:hypothetical protein
MILTSDKNRKESSPVRVKVIPNAEVAEHMLEVKAGQISIEKIGRHASEGYGGWYGGYRAAPS